ncbi:MAG: dephospho-CoA kinase [Aquificaceae bacterium]|nr:dephospho-CoA kinase [Aquificaceae bacterium]
MLKIALTGNMCSGKSTLGRLFQKAGFRLFDADLIIRNFYEERTEVYYKVVEIFGKDILNEDGSLNRKKLANIVFKDSKKLSLLEDITHGALYKKLEEEFKNMPEDSIAVVEASLLIEKGTYRNYHTTVLVYSTYELCKERALNSGYTLEDFERRWKRQKPPEEKLKYANFVVDNTGSLEKLQRRAEELIKIFKNWVYFQKA